MRLDFILSLEGDDDYICNLIKMHVILLLALNILSSTDLCVVQRHIFFLDFFILFFLNFATLIGTFPNHTK